jgi:radical SAM/Cys-rich protein
VRAGRGVLLMSRPATLPVLHELYRAGPRGDDHFARTLGERGLAPLVSARIETLQVNVGKRCNQACHHCHVEAGPKRTEMMSRAVAERALHVLARSEGVRTLDITGGAPELNENFRLLVEGATALGREVIDRCNLTILFEPGMDDLAAFLARHRVRVVASLPCYSESNVDKQRGRGVFDKSIAALRALNALGYGDNLPLDLVYNPLGAFLPPEQTSLEARYKEELRRNFGVRFSRLLTITNVPIKRFAEQLAREGKGETYMSLLVDHFNVSTVPGLMCRSLVSVGYDGRLFDCDFNQMEEMPLPQTIFDIDDVAALEGRAVRTASHCLACTAGSGSSCGGAIA